MGQRGFCTWLDKSCSSRAAQLQPQASQLVQERLFLPAGLGHGAAGAEQVWGVEQHRGVPRARNAPCARNASRAGDIPGARDAPGVGADPWVSTELPRHREQGDPCPASHPDPCPASHLRVLPSTGAQQSPGPAHLPCPAPARPLGQAGEVTPPVWPWLESSERGMQPLRKSGRSHIPPRWRVGMLPTLGTAAMG